MAMKNITRILLYQTFLILISCNTYQTIDGVYDYYGYSLQIKGDSATITFNTTSDIFSGATLTECKITPLGNGFYSLLSSNMPMIAFKNATIERVKRISNENPSVTFKFPNYNNFKTNPINIILTTKQSGVERSFICDSNDYSIQLPVKEMYGPDHEWEFNIGIAPSEYFTTSPFEYYFSGLLVYQDYFNTYNVTDHNLVLTFPNITNNLFIRWFLNDVIIKITDDNIILFGNKFKKQISLQ